MIKLWIRAVEVLRLVVVKFGSGVVNTMGLKSPTCG